MVYPLYRKLEKTKVTFKKGLCYQTDIREKYLFKYFIFKSVVLGSVCPKAMMFSKVLHTQW